MRRITRWYDDAGHLVREEIVEGPLTSEPALGPHLGPPAPPPPLHITCGVA